MTRRASADVNAWPEPSQPSSQQGLVGKSPFPELSVVIPVHDAGPHLIACLDSLAQQSVAMEIIIVDDGSTDGAIDRALEPATDPVIDGPKESRLDVDRPQSRSHRFDHLVTIIRQPRRGVSPARNLGFDKARGLFVAFLDADDIYLPETLPRLLAVASRSGADMVLGRSSILDDSSGLTRPFPDAALWRALLAGRSEVLASPLDEPLLYLLSPSPCPRLVRRSLIERSGVLFPDGVHYGEDLTTHLAWLAHSNLVHLLDLDVFLYRHDARQLERSRASASDTNDAMASLTAALEGVRTVELRPSIGAAISYRLLSRYSWLALSQKPEGLDILLAFGTSLFRRIPEPWVQSFLSDLGRDVELLREAGGSALLAHHPLHDFRLLLRALLEADSAYLRRAFTRGPSFWRSVRPLALRAEWSELARLIHRARRAKGNTANRSS